MLKLTGAVAAAALMITTFGATPAKAAMNVTYSTSGTFSNTGTAADTYFSYTGSGTSTVADPFPTAINLGTFTAAPTSAATESDAFTLTVNQTVPTTGGTSVTSTTLAGSISSNSSQVELSFAGDGQVYTYLGTDYVTFNIDGVEYGVQENTTLSPHSSNHGLTSLNGIVVSAVPEPGSMMLFGTVLAGVGFAMRKRFARS